MKEYSLKFTQLSKYVSCLVSNYSAVMNKFLMGVSSFFEEECHTTMLNHDMDISSLMVYSHQIEESKRRKMNRDGKKSRLNEPS